MTIDESVQLILNSTDCNPYSGHLRKTQHQIAAIALAELCKEFADNGQMEEAMNLDGNHWQQVIDKLKGT